MKPVFALLIALLLVATPTMLQAQDCTLPEVITVQPQASAATLTFVPVGSVDVADAASALAATTTQVTAEATVLSGPGSSFTPVGTLASGQTIRVDASNCTGQWLRTVLDDGQVGWISANYLQDLSAEVTLPVANVDTPVYATLQAMTLQLTADAEACTEDAQHGVLIQVPAAADPVPVQVNGIDMVIGGTVYVNLEADGTQSAAVLAGHARITDGTFSAAMDAGMQAFVELGAEAAVPDSLHIAPFSADAVMDLPLYILPEAVDVQANLTDDAPQIVGQAACRVISNLPDNLCPLHFVNRDGDAIVQMDVELVSAPYGEWSDSTHANPPILQGDDVSGVIAWNPTCSLGPACFIGPVVWSITLTDAAGNVSEPFETSFNCVDS
ncbi:MAG: SH3 domain-containing protein [Anaerolineae bacterium]|nr:SH3 domain-containing protein [Anaerolineae bacterium]